MKSTTKAVLIVILKLIIIAAIIFVSYKYLEYNDNNSAKHSFETFANQMRADAANYIKYAETSLIKPNTDATDTQGLSQAKKWSNKTLAQCIDNCNNDTGCIGFTRDNTHDNDTANCYPYEAINKCYTSMKGDDSQRKNALKFNTWFKPSSTDSGAAGAKQAYINMCIGGHPNTINRKILIKSLSNPNTFLGAKVGGRVQLIDMNDAQFAAACVFNIVDGLYGTGSVSFIQANSGKFLYRELPDSTGGIYITCSSINRDMKDNQLRASFYIVDGIANIDITQRHNGVSIQCNQNDRETSRHEHVYVTVDIGGTNSLVALPAETSDELKEKQTFEILDYDEFTNADRTDLIANTTMDTTGTTTNANTTTTNANTTTTNANTTTTMPLIGKLEAFSNPSDDLISVLYGVNSPKTNFIQQLQDDYYSPNNASIFSANSYNDVLNNKLDAINTSNLIGTILDKNQSDLLKYKTASANVEGTLYNTHDQINTTCENLIKRIDYMRMQDMATDLNFIQNLLKNKQ